MNFFIFNNGIVLKDGMSGSDIRAVEWSRVFFDRGHSLTIVVPQEGLLRFKELKINIKILVTTHFSLQKTGAFIGYILRTIKTCLLLNKLSVEGIVYSSSDLMPDAVPALFLKLKNKKLRWISGMHLIAPGPFKGFKKAKVKGLSFPTFKGAYFFVYQRAMMFFMRRLATLILVSNKQDREFLLKRGFRENQVMVAWGAVDRNAIKTGEQEIKFDACFIGREHPQKGTDDLLGIWQKVCREIPNARLCLLGELDKIRKAITFTSMRDNFKFFGVVGGIEKFEILKSAKLFICPSYYESFGIVIAEAMSVGLPVIAYSLDIYSDIYPGGMLKVPIADKNRFADAVVDLLRNEDKRMKLAKEALVISRSFSWENTANDILKELSLKR